MRITALGHSCVLVDIDTPQRPVRILVDPWLSDHATGDAMGRFPRVRFDTEQLGPLDGIFLSHGHSDHLDPYTLVRLNAELPTAPTLLLPISLSHLIPLFEEHLDNAPIVVLPPHEPTPFHGLELLGLYDIGMAPNNEDDVMVLVVTHGSERVLIEADARLSLEVPDFRAGVSWLMREPGITSAVYLTTENELTGTVEGRAVRSVAEREELVDHTVNELLEAVSELYIPSDDPDDLWHGSHVLRLIHGQGLTAPHELDPRWQHVLFPVTIEHRVREERAAAERAGFAHTIDSLTVGQVHTIVDGRIQERTPAPWLQLLDDESQRTFQPALNFFPDLPCAPLRPERRSVERQQALISGLLDERFLPYLHGVRQPPVLHLLSDGPYRIRVHYDDEVLDYVLGFGARGFLEEPAADEPPHETYWANDLEDFLDGHCDEFSNFCRTLFPDQEIRLWACLAMPLLNSDLAYQRVRIHFERAARGLTPGSYVLDLWQNPG